MNLSKVKASLISRASENGMNIFELSKKTQINIVRLVSIFYIPFFKLKLIEFVLICNALKVSSDDIFDIHFDTQRENQI